MITKSLEATLFAVGVIVEKASFIHLLRVNQMAHFFDTFTDDHLRMTIYGTKKKRKVPTELVWGFF